MTTEPDGEGFGPLEARCSLCSSLDVEFVQGFVWGSALVVVGHCRTCGRDFELQTTGRPT